MPRYNHKVETSLEGIEQLRRQKEDEKKERNLNVLLANFQQLRHILLIHKIRHQQLKIAHLLANEDETIVELVTLAQC